MADIIDIAQEAIEAEQERLLARIPKHGGVLAKGEPGDCEKCGEYSERLVLGECARCREVDERRAENARINANVRRRSIRVLTDKSDKSDSDEG